MPDYRHGFGPFGHICRAADTPAVRAASWVGRLVVALSALLFAAPLAWAQQAPAERITVEYAPPDDARHKPLHDLIKDNQGLERVREVLQPVRWPRTLRLTLKSCDGEANAWYEDGAVTICYEYLDDMWDGANSSRRPAAISRADAFVGPFVDMVLHEGAHALFDLLKIPLLGREEDAANTIAAYLVLQLPKETKRRLVLGGAYAYTRGLNVNRARDLTRLRLTVTRHVKAADEHSSGAQRLYNLLCIAYGSDQVLFADLVEKGFLPKERAEICEGEYRQIDHAYNALIAPHTDRGR
jgi:Putative metallopeptidase